MATFIESFIEYSYGSEIYSFTDPVGRIFECPICQGVVNKARSMKCCKKTFCKSCLDEALKRYLMCPHCRNENPLTYENEAIDGLVNDLKVLCLHHGKGCEWSGHLLHEPRHREEKCGYEEIQCEKWRSGCKVVRERRLMKKHVEEECEWREIPCKYCGELRGICKMKNHLLVCPEHPVECVNGCRVKGLLRRDIDRHLEVCPEALVDCPFKEMGCIEDQLKRKDIQSHTTNAVSEHLALVMKNLLETKQAMQKQANAHQWETRSLKASIEQLKADANTYKAKAKGLKTHLHQLQTYVDNHDIKANTMLSSQHRVSSGRGRVRPNTKWPS